MSANIIEFGAEYWETTRPDPAMLAAILANEPDFLVTMRLFALNFERLWARYEFDRRYHAMSPRQRKDWRRRGRKGMRR